ncbi:MAG: cell division protein ZapA [Lentimicrobium sp.]|jgi:cell division protein ZapA|nr:cell division protein ZapA [Lentimicrobium sp.]MDD2526666.1 cell division protein ZapA [Lentimicrobiaceae bacterium]MDD4596850.1 cell division protein ZapA [Lentimicrobiaceae bacterium]MDY0025291.1 cell division protein ZapA [Lentimicrobium sp.]HAH59375.1 hypothetical protein [Bacteroidales bacterium]
MDELAVTVNIADRPYKLRIERREEELVRNAAKSIEEQMKHYANHFEYKDKQDLLAMVALQFTTSNIEKENELNFRNQEMLKKLLEIDAALSKKV